MERLIIILMLAVSSASASDWYVATTGNNSTGDGSIGNPYLTGQKALDVSSVSDKAGQKNIWFRGGVYTNAFLNVDQFSVTNVLFSAYQNESVTLLGGQRLTGWVAAGSNGWYAVALPTFPTIDTATAGLSSWQPRTLIVDGRVVPRAKFPGTGKFAYTSFSGTSLVYTNTLEASTNGEVQTDCGWTDTELGITAINTGTKTITTTAAMNRNGGNCDTVTSWTLLNTPAGMTLSEQFWWNKTNNTIVYTGPNPASAVVWVPTGNRIVLAKGFTTQFLTNIVFSNITFACTSVPLNDGSKDDVGTFYFPAIDFYYSTNCAVMNCTVYGCAGKGIGNENTHPNSNFIVANCIIHDIGVSGIGFEGSPALIATNNLIYNCGTLCQAGTGIAAYEYAMIQGNVITNTVGAGIWIISPAGYRNGVKIWSNRVFSCAQQLRDLGAIYTVMTTNLSVIGNVIGFTFSTSNLFYNWTPLDSSATNWNNLHGLYLDYGTTKATVISNIIYDCDRAWIHHLGSNNYVSNNYFISTRSTEMQLNIHNSTNSPPLFTNNIIQVSGNWPRINIEDQNYNPYNINTNIGVSGVSNWIGNIIWATNGNNGLNPTNATTSDPQFIRVTYPKLLGFSGSTATNMGIKPLTFFDDASAGVLPSISISGGVSVSGRVTVAQ